MSKEDEALNYAKMVGSIPIPSRLEQQMVRKALTDSLSLMESMHEGTYRLDNNEAVKIMLRSCINQSRAALEYFPDQPVT